jgi:hypothetical protein
MLLKLPRCLALLCLPLLLPGCAPHANDIASQSSEGYAAPQWVPHGLAVQPRLAAYRDALPDDLGFEPGTTEWQDAQGEIPAHLGPEGTRSPSPGALLQALITELDLMAPLGRELWEQTQRVHQEDDTATGVVLQWGFKDDAVLGQDYRLAMREDTWGWFAERLETRYHCGRGVSEEGLCL